VEYYYSDILQKPVLKISGLHSGSLIMWSCSRWCHCFEVGCIADVSDILALSFVSVKWPLAGHC